MLKKKAKRKDSSVAGAQIKPCLKDGNPTKGYYLCYVARPARKNAKRHVAEYHVRGGSTIGFLGPRCTGARKRKDAVSFPGKQATEFAIFSCELYVKKPSGKDPERIYKRAEEMK